MKKWFLQFPISICNVFLTFSFSQVHYKFELMDETLFLMANLIDRFLERQMVVRKKLQLVGVTALLLACKYEEVSVPFVEDLVLISGSAYTRAEILTMVMLSRKRTGLFTTFNSWERTCNRHLYPWGPPF